MTKRTDDFAMPDAPDQGFDLAVGPDMTDGPDMTERPDMTQGPDMAEGPDMTPLPKALLALTPDPANAGTVTVGQQGTVRVSLRNDGNARAAELEWRLAGDNAFTLGSSQCGTSLAVGASCLFEVRFSPMQLDQHHATVTVTGAGGLSASAAIDGMGTDFAALQLTAPGPFSDRFVGDALVDPAVVTVSNTRLGTSSPLAPAQLDGADAAHFQIVDDGCAGKALPGKASCTIKVGFLPTSRGFKSATLVVGTDKKLSASLQGKALLHSHVIALNQVETLSFWADVPGSVDNEVTLHNTGDEPTLALKTQLGSGSDRFSLLPVPTCTDVKLAPGAECTIRLELNARVNGVVASTLTVTGADMPLTVELVGGFQTDLLLWMARIVDYGDNLTGWTMKPIWVANAKSNTPIGPLTVALDAGRRPELWEVAADHCSGKTLALGESCDVWVQLKPPIEAAAHMSAYLNVSGPGGTPAASSFLSGQTPAVLAR